MIDDASNPGPVVGGVDGCPAGWVLVLGVCDARGRIIRADAHVHERLGELLRHCTGARRVLIDIPLGLSTRVRTCDAMARRILGRHASRVFTPPCRHVLGCRSWAEANARSRAVSGRGLSHQAWNIARKIAEADSLVTSDSLARSLLEECHPEVCWWGLTGSIIAEGKKTQEGRSLRVRAIAPWWPGASRWLARTRAQAPRSVVADDDLLDAMVACVCAARNDAQARQLPVHDERDDADIPMRMVYRVVPGREPAVPELAEAVGDMRTSDAR